MDKATPQDFNDWFARFRPRLLALIRLKAGKKLLGKETASDIAQSVCKEVWQDIVAGSLEFTNDGAFGHIMKIALVRKLCDRAKHWERECRAIDREANDIDADTLMQGYESLATPSSCAAAKEELQRLGALLDRLPENQVEALIYVRLVGLGYAEAAAIMGNTESAVRGLVHRALAKLAELLGDEHGAT